MMGAIPQQMMKTVFLFLLMGFLLIELNLFVQMAKEGAHDEANDLLGLGDSADNFMAGKISKAVVQVKDNASLPVMALSMKTRDMRVTIEMSSVYSKYAGLIKQIEAGPKNSLPEINATKIREFIVQSNREQTMYNLDKFDLQSGSETLVLVVQVHNRVNYLEHLINSLRKAKNIEHSLLIFSHDIYDQEINTIVKAIDFCPVLQIFYPYPIQIYTHEFPGDDPNDCPRNITKLEALNKRCNNAESPDKYGHYREAKYSQTKHHWFWKINHVFDHVRVMKSFQGPVLFIEEDHYLVEDFIPVLRLAHQTCDECSVMTLGSYDKKPSYTASPITVFASDVKLANVNVTDWVSTKHNMGMAFNRTVWEKIKKCGQNFCRYDDYNWDWSLQFISHTCLHVRLKVIVLTSPRIFHIGECGVHHKGKQCNSSNKLFMIEKMLMQNKQYLYPDKLIIKTNRNTLPSIRKPKQNGGWGDYRDHELCTRFTDDSTHGR